MRSSGGRDQSVQAVSRVGWILATAAILAVGLIQGYSNRNYYLDDAFIVLRYGQNLAAGKGWCFNPGEQVNGSTSVLNTLAAAAAHRLAPTHPDWVLHSLDDLCFILSALLILAWFSRARSFAAGGVAAAALLADPLLHSTYGMETALLILLAMLSLWCCQTRSRFFGPVLALLPLARPEGLILSGLFLLRQFWKAKRVPWKESSLLAVAVPAWLLFSWLYFGDPFPQSLAAKTAQGASGLWSSKIMFWPGLLDQIQTLYPHWYRLLPAALLLLAGAAVTVRQPDPVGVIFIWAALLGVWYPLLQVPGYHWYYGPIFLSQDLLFGLGAYLILNIRLQRFPQREVWNQVAAWLLLGVLLIPMAWNLRQGYSLERPARERAYAEVADWISQNTDPGARLSAVELGTLAYYSQRNVVDPLGLVATPEMAVRLRRLQFQGWLQVYRPELILVHQPIWPLEQLLLDDPSFIAHYAPLHLFRFSQYRDLLLIGKINSES